MHAVGEAGISFIPLAPSSRARTIAPLTTTEGREPVEGMAGFAFSRGIDTIELAGPASIPRENKQSIARIGMRRHWYPGVMTIRTEEID